MVACLLMPADQKTLQSLAPMAKFLEADEHLARSSQISGWIFFTLSLFDYRVGEYAKAADWAQRCLTLDSKNDARTASMLIVNAMIEQKLGQTPAAQASLAAGQAAVDAAFANQSWLIPAKGRLYHWYNWLDTAVLLREAEGLVGSGNPKTTL